MHYTIDIELIDQIVGSSGDPQVTNCSAQGWFHRPSTDSSSPTPVRWHSASSRGSRCGTEDETSSKMRLGRVGGVEDGGKDYHSPRRVL